MADLLLILNTKNDMIYKRLFGQASPKEYLTQFLFAYAISDLTSEFINYQTDDFVYSVETQYGWRASIYYLNNGMSFIILESNKVAKTIEIFLKNVRKLFVNMILLDPFWEETEFIDDNNFNDKIDNLYNNICN